MGGSDGAGAEVPCEPVCGVGVGEFAFGDGGIGIQVGRMQP